MTYNNNHNGILNRALFYLMVNCCLLLLVMPVQAQQGGQSFAAFTAEQASQGEQLYTEQCASCHGYRLEGFELAPSLSGNYFSRRWGDKPVTELAANLQRMPPTVAGGLGQLAYSQILAYLLQQNGVDAGATALPEQLAALGDLLIPAQELVNRRFSPAIP
ncbi:MAG: c-type cytochrome, partial [Gammaproteobacteria bacterium]|nr:c-type cytochrome [Gammaproteobacteria bacterium]